jgi:hypothetical protein
MPERRSHIEWSAGARRIEVMRPKERWWHNAACRPAGVRPPRVPRGYVRTGERWWGGRMPILGPRPSLSLTPPFGVGPFWVLWPLDPLSCC